MKCLLGKELPNNFVLEKISNLEFVLIEESLGNSTRTCLYNFSFKFLDPSNASKWGSEAQNYYFPALENYANPPSGFFIAFCASAGTVMVTCFLSQANELLFNFFIRFSSHIHN